MLHDNPFSFNGFLIQISTHAKTIRPGGKHKLIRIVLITFAPVFYTAGIYLTLARMYALPPAPSYIID